MDLGQTWDEPPLANAPTPPQPLNGAARKAAANRNWIDAIPASAYEDPVHVMPTPIGPIFIVSNPDGVRRILVDEPEAYPKHAIHLTVTRLVFGEGLLSSEGETWRSHRRIMAPSFEPRTVATYGPTIAAAAAGLLADWDARAPGAEVDIGDEMNALALKVISNTMFAADSDAVMDIAGQAMRTALAIRPHFLDLLPVISTLRRRANERRVAGVFGDLDAAVARMVGEREAAADDDGPHDLLSRLVAAKDEASGGRMSPREMRDQVVTIFLAGHETTAVALTWIWYVLSQRPEAEARLHAELDEVLGGRAADATDLPRLGFTRALVQEVMRLYPPVPNLLARRAAKADTIAGVRIPRGAMVAVTPWIVHRHRRLWDDPERFNPERFLGEAAGRPRLAYIPFGAGPRICIGAQLAMTEIMLALAGLAQRYRPRLAPGQTVELQHRVTLRPVGGLRMQLERR